MFFNSSMKQFIDGSGSPDYFVQDEKYYIKHKIKDEYFEHEFKIYYKNCNRYFMGISISNLVRQITAQDYNTVLLKRNNSKKSVKKYIQLTLF